MKIKNLFLVFLYLLITLNMLIQDAFLQSELFFIISLFSLLIFFLINKSSLRSDLSKVYPLLFVAFIGLLFSSQNESSFIMRDFYYYTNHIVIFLFGASMAKKISLNIFFRYYVMLSIFLLIIFLLKLIYLNISSYEYLSEFSYTAAYASLFPICFAIIFLSRHYKFQFLSPYYYYFLALILLQIYFLDSRTSVVSTIVLVLVGLNTVNSTSFKSITKNLLIFLTIFLLSYIIILFTNTPMVERFYSSFDELNPFTAYNNLSDINRNWRGFEGYVSLLDFWNSGLINKIFGNGFGKEIYLGFEILLGESVHDKIYVFHNGYVNLLIKTGILGLIIYLYYFILNFFRYNKNLKTLNVELRLIRSLICGISILILFITFSVAGLMNLSIFPVMFTYGFLIKKESILTNSF